MKAVENPIVRSRTRTNRCWSVGAPGAISRRRIQPEYGFAPGRALRVVGAQLYATILQVNDVEVLCLSWSIAQVVVATSKGSR